MNNAGALLLRARAPLTRTPQLQPLSDLLVQKLNKKSRSIHPSGEKAILCIVFIRKTK